MQILEELWCLLLSTCCCMGTYCIYTVYTLCLAMRGRDRLWQWKSAICTKWALTNCSQQSLKNCFIIITAAIIHTVHVWSCVIMCLCVQVCLFHLICLSVLVCFMINDTLLIFKSLWVCVKITIHSFQMSSHLSFSASPSVHRFSVNVEPGTKLERGPASLHLCNNLLVLTRGVPPVVIGHWKLSALRRYGAVPNGFVFEGGTRCGYCK